MSFQAQEWVSLAPLTTFELGGPARFFAEPSSETDLNLALDFARARSLPVLIIGGGSNLVISDDGFPGLALHLNLKGHRDEGEGRFTIAAGESFDSMVEFFIEKGWAGLECLSGIPGTMGAAPVQNIGAYGQEIADTLIEVHVLDRRTHTLGQLSRDACSFSYRQSLFKREPHRFVILDVTLELDPKTPALPRNAELTRALPAQANVRQIREAVLSIRRQKGMVYDRSHPCHRSVGSFFTNPTMTPATADAIADCALSLGQIRTQGELPRYLLPDGHVKIPAAWIIEKSGIPKGFRQGPVGISPHHALALVHYGGGTTAQLVQLARDVQETVFKRFQVALIPEPVFIGID